MRLWTRFLTVAAVLAVVIVATGREVYDRTEKPEPRGERVGYRAAPERTERALDNFHILPNHLDLQKGAMLANDAVIKGDFDKAERALANLSRTWSSYKEARRERGYGGILKTADLDASIPAAIRAVRSGSKSAAMNAIGRVRNDINTRS